MQRLASQSGAIAVVITTQCEEKAFTVRASQPELLSGEIFTPDVTTQPGASPQSVAQPFDSLALVYYTEPASPRVPPQDRLPIKSAFPSPPAVGEVERHLSCAQLDTELSRAEALRWLARDHEATPFTGAEKLSLHAQHAAVDAAVAVGVAAMLVGSAGAGYTAGGGSVGVPGFGGGSSSSPSRYGENVWYVAPEEFRWSISGIDARVEGLLRLKKQNQCAGRPALQAGTTDLTLLEGFDAWKAQQSPVPEEHTVLAKRTEAFDQLGPKAVGLDRKAARAYVQAAHLHAAQQLLPPDERVDQVLSHAIWFGETRSAWARARKLMGGEAPQGVIIVTDKSFLFASEPDKAGVDPNGLQKTVQIPYSQVESVQVGNLMLNKWVMIRTKDGREQFFCIKGPSTTVDRESTQAAADLLRAKIGSGTTTRSLDNQPETR
jgi:hypothetical protein